MDEIIEITQEQLEVALAKWESAARLGAWPSATNMPVETKAARSAEYLWGLLKQK